MLDSTQLIGVIGVLLVFTSFTIRNWMWLYMFNLLGTLLLNVYAIIRRDAVFAVLEAGIAVFLAYRLISEYRSSKEKSSN